MERWPLDGEWMEYSGVERRSCGNCQTISSIGLTAMADAANLDRADIWTNEEEAIVSNAQPKFLSALEGFHVACARFREPVQG